jgi:DNA-binding NtrC family response regulator
MANILVVDDELGIRDLLCRKFSTTKATVSKWRRTRAGARSPPAGPYDLVLLDIWMPDTDGVTLLKEWASPAC